MENETMKKSRRRKKVFLEGMGMTKKGSKP